MSAALQAHRLARAAILLVDASRDHGVSVEDIRGRSRVPRIVAARHSWWVVLRASGLSYEQIGRIVGVNHSSVRHAVTKRHAELWP